MKKEHRLFIIQVAIAIAVLVIASQVINSIFSKDPKAETYLSFDEGVKKMATSSSALIDSLIVRKDLTFDPTSGKFLDKVLSNLKYTEKNKFLIIGSSQMRVVQGQSIQKSYKKLVSRKIREYTKDKYNTYNLSLGGMTTLEKIIMAQKNIEILNPDRVLISVTPWDCISDKIRPEVKAIENKKFKIVETETKENAVTLNVESDQVFPLSLNSAASRLVDNAVEDIEVYNKRIAIKKWLNDKTYETLNKIQQSTNEKEEDTFKTNITEYWRTGTQDLDNITGWDKEFAHEGTKSIKIVNTKSQNAKWFGDDITLERATTTFEFEGWSKAEKVSTGTKLYCLDFQVIFEDGTDKWYFKGLKFGKGTHDWQKVSTKVRFDKKVKVIKPHLLFYGGTGTVWFDGIKARPVYEGKAGENILPNSNFELELKERLNVSYSYTKAEWDRIKQNMFSIVDFLSSQKNKDQNVLLMTPFWHTKTKTAYPQKAQYKNLVEAVKNYCKQKNVSFVDASYILSKDNFGIYTNGSVRDKIDVLHFNADAHDKLAKYIIKELKL